MEFYSKAGAHELIENSIPNVKILSMVELGFLRSARSKRPSVIYVGRVNGSDIAGKSFALGGVSFGITAADEWIVFDEMTESGNALNVQFTGYRATVAVMGDVAGAPGAAIDYTVRKIHSWWDAAAGNHRFGLINYCEQLKITDGAAIDQTVNITNGLIDTHVVTTPNNLVLDGLVGGVVQFTTNVTKQNNRRMAYWSDNRSLTIMNTSNYFYLDLVLNISSVLFNVRLYAGEIKTIYFEPFVAAICNIGAYSPESLLRANFWTMTINAGVDLPAFANEIYLPIVNQ